ncbi:MAG: NYN domain-containing protein [Vicinamibacterales bacterium]
MSDQKLKIAVFIDFDNVEIGVKTTLGLQFDIGAVLEAIKERGEIVTKVAYGDWKRSGDYGRAMSNHAVRLVQRVMTPGGDKNGADINLALDALEMAFTHAHINAFVIVGGDSDFITLVEKLKQYDRKVFVVGGRSFTSQVMQKNCTEFIAYENVVPDRRAHRQDRGERPRVAAGTQSIDGAMPLVKRALKVLADREVTPQLGLLKSTLLQLDSSFSERDYGSGSFRDFADKLAQHGIVTLKHQGRSTLVELVEGGEAVAPAGPVEGAAAAAIALPAGEELEESARAAEAEAQAAAPHAPRELRRGREEDRYGAPGPQQNGAPGLQSRRETADAASLGEGVALVRRVLGEGSAQPRWPMYPRQFKQFLRAADPTFDERKYGSIAELMRACQKDGILKLERDRQGGLRVFAAGGGTPRVAVPHGWSILAGGQPGASALEETGEGPEIPEDLPPPAATVSHELPDDDIGNRIVGGAVDVTRVMIGGVGGGRMAPPLSDDDTQPEMDEPQPPAPKAKRARKTAAKKTAAKRTTTRRKKE